MPGADEGCRGVRRKEVEDSDHDARKNDRARHVASRFARLFGERSGCLKAHEGEHHEHAAGDDSRHPVIALDRRVLQREDIPGIAPGCGVRNEPDGERDEDQHLERTKTTPNHVLSLTPR